jgi:hypothetical protein
MYRLITVIVFVGSVVWLANDPGFEPAIACIVAIGAVFRDEFHAMVGARLPSLTPRSAPLRNTCEPFAADPTRRLGDPYA